MLAKLITRFCLLLLILFISAGVRAGTFQARCRLDITCDDKRTVREEYDKTFSVIPKREAGAFVFPTLTDACTQVFGSEAQYCQTVASRCNGAGMISGLTGCLVQGAIENIVMSIRCTQKCSPAPLTKPLEKGNAGDQLLILPK